MEKLPERLEMALGAMANRGPRNLRAYLEQPGPDFEKADASEVDQIIDQCLSSDPNHPARLLFSTVLRSWDNVKEATWVDHTARNTGARRTLIHKLLHSDSDLESRIGAALPFFHIEEPLIISEIHQDWYFPQPGVRDYYWSTYIKYLRERKGWEEHSLLNMDNTTRAIIECLADPTSADSYASRGLVMGYVQSGKTANFTGVVARAADAGYRLIIVMAGAWNILRNQTQRRFDKELLGKELLANDQSYLAQPPSDWEEFLEHDTNPLELGHYTWQRLTRPDIDFQGLTAAIDNLEFERRDRSRPLFDPINLHALPVKFLVVKKHSGILHKLVKDLSGLQTNVADLPTLIIDDESDQAGLNTVDPRRPVVKGKERSKTNLRIVELLKLFPRGQYVGYTATPYANALVNPDDPLDLFPKDFIVSLDRPRGYMGVSDFFDPLSAYQDLKKDDYTIPEIAYIRRVSNPQGSDDEDLKSALRSYVLAGGMKLYRHANDAARYKTEHVKHHTMLVHTSSSIGEHTSLGDRLTDLWTQCAFNSPKGLAALLELWHQDYAKVCSAIGKELTPTSFEELIPYVSETIKRIEKDRFYLIVNSDTAKAPDFSAAPVWKVVVGGNKLSRGYTIEGLTISYYRRVTGTADTLMQMGRWFGFRPGYQDLVRVFLGVNEGRLGNVDLVSLFKEVCRMEEGFRDDIKRYVRTPGQKPITPKEIPPMIAVSGNLPPTATNKRFNAVLASKNFGGRRSTPTLTAAKSVGMEENLRILEPLLVGSKTVDGKIIGGISSDGKKLESQVLLYEASNEQVIAFLEGYRWLETDYKYPDRPADVGLQIEFLKKQNHEITSWLIVAPQRKSSFGAPLKINGVGDFAVKERHRIEGRGFQVFGEPPHRLIADWLAELSIGKLMLASANTVTNSLKNAHRGVFLLYPVREESVGEVSVGFELLFPKNSLPFDLNFTVRRTSESAKIVIQTPATVRIKA